MKRIITFLCYCFGISLTAALIFILCHGKLCSIPGTIFSLGYMFIPLVSVVLTQLTLGEKPFTNCGLNFHFNNWWNFAWLFMPVVIFLIIGVSLLFPETEVTPIPSFWKVLLLGLAAGATINALTAFGEEIAWRGYLVDCLKGHCFWCKAFWIGLIWGVWHAPLIYMGLNYPHHPYIGIGMMILMCLLMTPLLLFIRERATSTIAATISHGTLNALAGLTLISFTNYSELRTGVTGAAGMIVFAIIDITIFLYMHIEAHQ